MKTVPVVLITVQLLVPATQGEASDDIVHFVENRLPDTGAVDWEITQLATATVEYDPGEFDEDPSLRDVRDIEEIR